MRKLGSLTGYIPRGMYLSQDKVPFEEILPLKLKTKVSGKSDRTKKAACIQEMSVLFACLKKNDFKESPCSQEISTFQNCYETNAKEMKMKEERERQGVLVPGEKRLSHKQVNEMLKRYPG